MFQNFNRNDRRILKFPAVNPCESISPATLLDSLIILARKISSYQPKSFSIQKRNARQTLRLIGNLLIFFEEIQETGLILPNSVTLCFSELHLTFQRILFLLQDCTRPGARIWILMKAHFMVTQFRDLIRTVATALDVLPTNSINIYRETLELVDLVARQARAVKFELDPDDDNAMRKVILILNQFENGFETDPIMIKRVVNYLGIRDWSECHKEVKFLEEEIGYECSDNNERELPLLSSLVGLMSYCRGVLFENSEFLNTDKSDERCNEEVVSFLNLEDFRCPISLELMTDPVTVTTGQTYDRASIQKWFKAGNLLCPKTGAILSSTELVPNTSLRKIIHQFCADHGVSLAKTSKKNRDISRTILPGSPAAAAAIRFLSEFLTARLYNGTDRQKNKAAYEIRLLGKSNIFNRFCLIERGTIRPLLTLLASTDSSIQENAIAALLKLSKHSNGKKIIVNNGGLELIVGVLKDGLKLEAKQTAAAIVFYLSSVSKYRKMMGEETEAIPALVELIRNGTSFGKKNGVVAIFGLLICPRNHHKVLEAGIVPLLVDDILATSDKADLVTDSLAILAKLSESYDGSSYIGQAKCLSVILRVFKTSSSRSSKEYCASILLSLCNYCGGDVVGTLAKDPSIMTSLYSLVSDGNGASSSSNKARSIIRMIHRYHESSTSQLMNNEFREERFIHVR